MTQRSKRWFKSGAPSKEAGGAGSSSNDGNAVAALPACSDGFDNVDGSPEPGGYSQMRRTGQGYPGTNPIVATALLALPSPFVLTNTWSCEAVSTYGCLR
jgi:hypothetical protein